MAKGEQRGAASAGMGAAQSNTIRAIVLPNNSYGKLGAGTIVEVEPDELRAVPHCLMALEEYERQQAEAAKPPEPNQWHETQKAAVMEMARNAEVGRQRLIEMREEQLQKAKGKRHPEPDEG